MANLRTTYTDMSDNEKQVAKFLRELDLWWLYEFPVFVYDEKDRPRVWTPDFFIPKLGIFIEVCGSEDFNYKYREDIYRKNEFYVLFVHCYKEGEKWKNYLIKRITELMQQRYDEVMKMYNTIKNSGV